MITGLKKYYKSIVWIIIMQYLLFSPASGIPKPGILVIPHFDKLVHFGMFFILIYLFVLESRKKGIVNNRNTMLFILLSVFYAALSECCQHMLITGREGSFADFIADILGILTGLVAFKLSKPIIYKYFTKY